MKRVFKGVPHLYGFHSVGPSGKSIVGMLERYHEQVPDYHQHLLKIEMRRALSLMNDFTEWNQDNKVLAQSLKLTNFAQTSGLFTPCLDSPHGLDERYEILNNICRLRGEEHLSAQEALAHITNLLLLNDFPLYVPAIDDYIKSHPFQNDWKATLGQNPSIKKNILGLQKKAQTGMGKIQVANIALRFGLISQEKWLQIEQQALLSYLSPPVSLSDGDTLCSYDLWDQNGDKRKIQLQKNDLDHSIFTDPHGLQALLCLELDDRGIVYSILDVAQNHRDAKMRIGAMVTLGLSQKRDEKVENFLREQMLPGKSPDEQIAAALVLSSLDRGNPLLQDKLAKIVNSTRVFRIYGHTLPEKRFAKIIFSRLQFPDLAQLKQIYSQLQGPEEKKRWLFIKAVCRLDGDSLLEFFADPNYQDDKELRRDIYSGLFQSDRGSEPKVDIRVLAYYLREMAMVEETSQLYFTHEFFSNLDADTEDKQRQIFHSIEQAQLPKTRLRGLLRNLEIKQRMGTAAMKFVLRLYQSDRRYYKHSLNSFLSDIQDFSKAEKKILHESLNKNDLHEGTKKHLREMGIVYFKTNLP